MERVLIPRTHFADEATVVEIKEYQFSHDEENIEQDLRFDAQDIHIVHNHDKDFLNCKLMKRQISSI